MRIKQIKSYWIYMIACFMFCTFQHVTVLLAETMNPYGVLKDNPYVVNRFMQDGKWIHQIVVPPGIPPEDFLEPDAIIPESDPAAGTSTLTNVPAFYWSYGCSPTAAAILFGFYDNTGYPNVYTGPTNGGIIPMTNAVWGPSPEGRGECPLSATHLGIDGRTTRGHVDDYWIKLGNGDPDPFMGNWTEHTYGECVADFMGTSQYKYRVLDGYTDFYWFEDGSPYYCYPAIEGCSGLRLFFESRGYTVDSVFTQPIKGYMGHSLGFTFEDYKMEIDLGRPVLLILNGHMMLGYGYNDAGKIIYIKTTWGYRSDQMTWGGIWVDFQHIGVVVFRPSPDGREKMTLTVNKSGTGLGTVSSEDPGGINCGLTCSGSYEYGTTVILTAIADTGSTFTGWTGCDSVIENTCFVETTSNRYVSATFTLNRHTLTLAKSGDGTGRVVGDGISCGSDCTEVYDYGTVTHLNAVANTGSSFASWTGCNIANGSECVAIMTEDKGVTATFLINQHTLNITKTGNGSGTLDAPGLSCLGDACTGTYNYDSTVTIIATAENGSFFVGWAGCDLAIGDICTMVINGDRNVIATFDETNRGTIGSSIALTGSGFGAKKGKVLLEVKKYASAMLSIAPSTGVAAKTLTWSDSAITFMIKKPLPIGSYDIVVQPKQPKGVTPIIYKDAFTMMGPEITSINPETGFSGEVIKVLGNYFGSKKGKVYLGTTQCKVTSWTNDTITFTVPNNIMQGSYDVIVSNKVGAVTLPSGFTIH